MNQFEPDATALGADHPIALRSANFSVVFSSSLSIQLRRGPCCSDTVSWGPTLPGDAGVVSGSTLIVQGAGSADADEAATASAAAKPKQIITRRFIYTR